MYIYVITHPYHRNGPIFVSQGAPGADGNNGATGATGTCCKYPYISGIVVVFLYPYKYIQHLWYDFATITINGAVCNIGPSVFYRYRAAPARRESKDHLELLVSRYGSII